MNKAVLPDINTGMGGHIVLKKNHQIAGAQCFARERLTPIAQQGHGARRLDTCTGLVNMPDQATAVKAGIRGVAAITVRCPDQAQRIHGDISGLLRRHLRAVV